MNTPNINCLLANSLRITASIVLVLFTFGCSSSSDGTTSHTVSANAGANGSISPASVSVNRNSTALFSVTANAGYTIDTISGCGGSLAGNTYATAAITADCNVSVTFRLISFEVGTDVGANGSISPTSASVNQNSSTDFVITPNSGYVIDTVTGCGGSLTADTYTTGSITADCSVSATFVVRVTTAITDIFVHDENNGAFQLAGYTAIVRCDPSIPDCAERVSGWDVNLGIGGDTVKVWMKQEEVAENSDATVITDVIVTQWSSNDTWFPTCPTGYEFASGNNFPSQNSPVGSALTTGTTNSCNRMGMCVSKATMKDATVNRPLATINLGVSFDGSILSPPIAATNGTKATGSDRFLRTSTTRDIHESCGDTFYKIAGYRTEPDSSLLPKPEMDVVLQPELEPDPDKSRRIVLLENGFPLDFHSLAGVRTEHLQAMIRLPDSNDMEYYMGTFSQDCEGNDCGMVFVGEVPGGAGSGSVIWMDFLDAAHPALGFNHPGDLHRIGDYVIVAGQNWDICWGVECLDIGGGGQAVLFYDVSDPANPSYVGKMNTCWQGDEINNPSRDIDTIGVAKIDSTYYLSFNNIRCKSDSFHPNAHWEIVAEGKSPSDSPAKFDFGGTTYVGKASVAVAIEPISGLPIDWFITWKAYTDDFNTLTDVLTTQRPPGDFILDAKSLSILADGTYCAISTDVESDVNMIFKMQCN